MAIKINFDLSGNPEKPTLVLSYRNGEKIGQVNAENIVISGQLKNPDEISFKVHKILNGDKNNVWDEINDFKLIWCREWDTWFEINVNTEETNEIVKTVTCKKLGEAELSQIIVYNTQINTEEDIARDDYVPTVLYNENNKNASLIDRLLEKAPHYSVRHVDNTIKNIQRTFSFNNKSIYDSFQEVSEEEDVLFIFDSNSDSNGNIQRKISVYDLEDNCLDCGYRGQNIIEQCPKCNSTNILYGYGKDTNIFVTSDELAKNINYFVETDKVKNCFRLEAGDDLMTATIRNINPNGSNYIWNISDDIKKDMPKELANKIAEYDSQYNYYKNDYVVEFFSFNNFDNYNSLIKKYKIYNADLTEIPNSAVGYLNLMKAYYDTIDFRLFLTSVLMPKVEIKDTNAIEQVGIINGLNNLEVSVLNIDNISLQTANSAVLSMIKIFVDSKYKVSIISSSIVNNVWSGSFNVKNIHDDTDVADSNIVNFNITDNYENFVKQKIEKMLNKKTGSNTISDLFKMPLADFEKELKKYCLNRLVSFNDACQACLDILIEQGIADDSTTELYNKLYDPYYKKLEAIKKETKLREEEIYIIYGERDENNNLVKNGMQDDIADVKNNIQEYLNFESFLGEKLWKDFCAYKREDTYTNNNYISDGLNNNELFEKAQEFLNVATKEIYKSSYLQHKISTNLNNLLVIKKFESLKENFEVGNWIRILADNEIYKLRLISYQINFDNLSDLTVDFSDVLLTDVGYQEEIIEQSQSMATSYGAVQKQAKQGESSKTQLNDWVNKGLALTKMKIVDSADNQNVTFDSHGLLCREYLPITDDYDDKQLKIINKGLFLTDDNWRTSRAGIGNFTFFNPISNKFEESYGVIANTLIGNLVLSEQVGVYTKNGNIHLGENGLIITTYKRKEDEKNNKIFLIQKKITDQTGEGSSNPLMYVDDDGNLVLKGTVKIDSVNSGVNSVNDLADESRYDERINNAISSERVLINQSIDNQFNSAKQYSYDILNDYKTSVGQYLTFDENGLTLGATTSPFKTVINNDGLYFKEGNTIISYVNNKQLHIPNAVIENTMILGKFFFSPRSDGGVSLTWQE